MMQINEKKEKKLIGYLAGILVEADFDFILTTHGQYDNDFKQELIFRKINSWQGESNSWRRVKDAWLEDAVLCDSAGVFNIYG